MTDDALIADSFGYPDASVHSEADVQAMKDRLEALRGEFLTVFSGSPSSDSVLAYLYDYCGVGSPSYMPGMDPQEVAFREGKRKVALWVMGLLRMDDEALWRIARGVRAEG